MKTEAKKTEGVGYIPEKCKEWFTKNAIILYLFGKTRRKNCVDFIRFSKQREMLLFLRRKRKNNKVAQGECIVWKMCFSTIIIYASHRGF